MPQQPNSNTQRRPSRKPRTPPGVHHTNILQIVLTIGIIHGLNHGRSQIQIRNEALLVVEAKFMPPLYVERQPRWLHVHGGEPVLLCAEEPLRLNEVLVDV